MLTLGVLGSGSGGNSFVISNGKTAIAVDAGFSGREQEQRMRQLDLTSGKLQAVLLTHEHTDHYQGCRVWCDRLGIPLYASCGTGNYLAGHAKLPRKMVCFEHDRPFEIGDFLICPFPVPHDACDPVGFSVHCDGVKLGIATDLGEISPVVAENLRDCDGLVIECNYEMSRLRDSDRHERLKRRIASRTGHLEINDTKNALPQLITDRTHLLLYSHLSCECNSPELAENSGREALRQLGRTDIVFSVIPQHRALGKFIFSDGEVAFVEANTDAE